MVLRIHGKDESVVRFRQGAPLCRLKVDTSYQSFFIRWNRTFLNHCIKIDLKGTAISDTKISM